MLSQREEKMISDKTHAIDMCMFDLERMMDRAQTDEDRQSITMKMKQLAETRERLRDEYENVGVGITNMLTGPMHMALPAPPVPPGLSRPSMPPLPSSPHPFYPYFEP